MLIEYIIIAIAFAIMLHIRYTMEVLKIIEDLRFHLDIEEEKNPFSPLIFSIAFFIYTAIFMPIMVFYIFFVNRQQVLKDISGAILKSYFSLEEK